jgi:hypothetical protein
MNTENFKKKYNYVEHPESSCGNCKHASRKARGNDLGLYCNAGNFFTNFDGKCSNFGE